MIEESKRTLKNWAHLRFSIVGPLLARPPEKGELAKELEKLSSRRYPHPSHEGEWIKFGVSTIERWYYEAAKSDDPIKALSRKTRSDVGQGRAIGPLVSKYLQNQYGVYSDWSYKLHADNLAAYLMEQKQQPPSYSSVRRLMMAKGWLKKSRPKTPGQELAAKRLEEREVRSFEAEYVHQLWHLDFHHGRLRVVGSKGDWATPKALCVLDDRSRLCCHLQWYLGETAEDLIHGLIQALCKRGLPRSLMSDNGSAMEAGETENGLLRLGVVHEKTLPYSAYQNGKLEVFWAQLEGRLLSMLTQVKPLTLDFLNRASQAWVEQEYNRAVHSEIGTSPLKRLLKETSVARPCPENGLLKLAFSLEETRTQRRSDGTLSISGVRFEVPARLRHIQKLRIRYQSWDLSIAYLVDPRDGSLIDNIYPQDKAKNASGLRRVMAAICDPLPEAKRVDDPIPPLLRKLLADYAATGLPPAYIPKNEIHPKEDDPHDV
jgi:transposase InsO family protein